MNEASFEYDAYIITPQNNQKQKEASVKTQDYN